VGVEFIGMIDHYHICPSCDEMWNDCEENDSKYIEKYCDKCYAIAEEAHKP